MSWVDLLIIAIIAWTTFRAFSVGLIREVVNLGALIVGIILAGFLYDDLAANLDFLIDSSTTRNLIAFLAILGGIVVAGQVIAVLLKQTAALLFLGPFDHLGGAFFGFVKGIIFAQILLIAVAVFPAWETLSRAVDDSTLAPILVDWLPSVEALLPAEFDLPLDQLEEWRERFGGVLPDALSHRPGR